MFDDIVCLSHLRWSFVYQRPNHLMSRWARQHRVFFVEEPIFDVRWPRLEVVKGENGLHVATPHLPQGMPAPLAERIQEGLLEGLLNRARVRAPLLWFYTPMALGYAARVDACAVVYDCMDELSHFRGAPAEMRERERELFARADIVFTGGHALYEAKRAFHPRVHPFPSSVDALHFERARSALPDPTDQRRIPRPRLGYFGVVDERMDMALIRALAERRPDLSVVLVGPVVKIDPASIPKLPNIHHLGPKSYEELPAYIANWDVAIMPFARNDATKFISPTKTLEYLAAGKTVVSTSIRDVVSPYGARGLVRIADDDRDFASAVDAALAERNDPSARRKHAERDALLRQTSWDKTWARMRALILEVLEGRERAAEPQEVAPCSTI